MRCRRKRKTGTDERWQRVVGPPLKESFVDFGFIDGADVTGIGNFFSGQKFAGKKNPSLSRVLPVSIESGESGRFPAETCFIQ